MATAAATVAAVSAARAATLANPTTEESRRPRLSHSLVFFTSLQSSPRRPYSFYHRHLLSDARHGVHLFLFPSGDASIPSCPSQPTLSPAPPPSFLALPLSFSSLRSLPNHPPTPYVPLTTRSCHIFPSLCLPDFSSSRRLLSSRRLVRLIERVRIFLSGPARTRQRPLYQDLSTMLWNPLDQGEACCSKAERSTPINIYDFRTHLPLSTAWTCLQHPRCCPRPRTLPACALTVGSQNLQGL